MAVLLYFTARCYAVCRKMSVRLSVYLSVTRWYPVKTAKHPQTFFTIGYSHHCSFCVAYQTIWQHSDGTPNGGVECKNGMKNSRFATNISLYLGNDARWSRSYY